MTYQRLWPISILALAVGLTVGACGGDDDDDKGDSAAGGTGGGKGGSGGATDGGGTGGSGGTTGSDAGGDAAATPSAEFASIYSTIISTSCSPCHTTNATKAGMLDMSSAATALANLVGVTSPACAGKVRVVAAKPDESYIIAKLTGAAGICGVRMPRGCVEATDGGAGDAAALVPQPLDAAAVADAAAPADAAVADAGAPADAATAGDGGAADAAPPARACLAPSAVTTIRTWIMNGAK
jgi:hypothetical protein